MPRWLLHPGAISRATQNVDALVGSAADGDHGVECEPPRSRNGRWV